MLLWCLDSIKFWLKPTNSLEVDGCPLKNFKMDSVVLAILNLHIYQMLPTKFRLNLTYPSEADAIWRFLRWPWWQPSWISQGTILAMLNLCVALMPPIKFQLNPTNRLGDVVWRISRWLPWQMPWPSWILEWTNFSNSDYPCLPNASHQVSA